MRKKYSAIIAFLLPAAALADCPALDYQELKEMPAASLTKEYCANTVKAKKYTQDAQSEHEFAAGLRKANELYFTMERSRDAGEAEDKGKKLEEAAEQCKSQGERILRVLSIQKAAETAPDKLCI